MPTNVQRHAVTRDAERGAARTSAPTHADTRNDRVRAAMASGHAAHAATVLERHNASHTGAAFQHKHHCPHCAAIVDTRTQREQASLRAAEQAAAQRAQRATDATRNATRNVDTTNDTPTRIGTKRRTTRHLVTPTRTGDATSNGTPRKQRATQRYAHDTRTHLVDDTRTTHANGVTYVTRNTQRHVMRGEGGDIDARATLLLLGFIRHAIACRHNAHKENN